jgi:hypothetical protein
MDSVVTSIMCFSVLNTGMDKDDKYEMTFLQTVISNTQEVLHLKHSYTLKGYGIV